MKRHMAMTLLALAALWGVPATGSAQSCKAICSPVFLWQGGTITQNAFNNLNTTTDFNLRFTIAAPTAIPRVSLVGLFQWQPFASATVNPFNGRTGDIHGNLPAIVYGGTIALVRSQDTNGWFNSSLDILGLFSPSAKPEDTRDYTHKFLPELYVDFSPFNRMPQDRWLHGVSVYALLDYVATGLPSGTKQPWPIVAGLQFPIAPLH